MKTELKAYHNSKEIKKKYVTRIVCHRKADELIHGTYWENGKGCAIGCILEKPEGCHKLFETELGLPEWLARLIDYLFEAMGNGQAKEFPEKVLKSIKVGANLDITYHKFCLFLLKEVCKNTDNPIVKPSIDKIIELHTRVLKYHKTEVVTKEEWSAAESAAESAAWSAVRLAAWSARSAAESAESAAWSAAIIKIVDKLIELLKESNKK